MLPCVCSLKDHRRRRNEVRTSVTHSAIASGAIFLFLPHFDVICDLSLNSVSDTISSWFENHQPQKTKISTVIYAPFIQNSNQMASRLNVTAIFPRVFFNSCNFQGNVQAFRLTGLLRWQKNDLIFPAFSSRFVDFSVQLFFRCKFSFNEAGWQWRDFSRPITFLCYA